MRRFCRPQSMEVIHVIAEFTKPGRIREKRANSGYVFEERLIVLYYLKNEVFATVHPALTFL